MLEGSRLVSWEIVYTKQAQKDAKKLSQSGLKSKAKKLIETIALYTKFMKTKKSLRSFGCGRITNNGI